MVSRDAYALKPVKPKTGLSVEQVHAQWINSQLDWLPNAHRLCRAEALGELDTRHERLLRLGATVVHDKDEWNVRWTTLSDPECNEFCVATH